MKFYYNIPKSLYPFYKKELDTATSLLQEGKMQECWIHYERAHILGQSYPFQHTYVHWKMLKFGIKIKNTKEVIGQIPRLLVGGVKSFVGYIPLGNTGGANVPPLQTMEIPEDLLNIIKTHTNDETTIQR